MKKYPTGYRRDNQSLLKLQTLWLVFTECGRR